MAKLRGRGVAAVNYPTGMNLGGDPSQALIHATTTGSFVVTLSSVDLGQGIKTIAAQCAAETLGLPFENILVDTADTDTGPHCMGTFASRGTHRVGNAVIMAAREARAVMLEVADEEPEVDVDDETGVIEVLSLHNTYEVGRALNPALATQQVEGGAWMGVSHALFETTEPYYPRRDHGPRDFAEYLMPGPADIPVQHSLFLERPAGNGPYGAKG